MNITLSPNALELVDTYRKANGIRTRKAALEAMLSKAAEVVLEHPLDKKLREARANPSSEKIPARVKRSFEKMRREREAGTLQVVSHAEMLALLERRKNGNLH